MYNISDYSNTERIVEMKHGFIKVAAATPQISVADCQGNAEKIIKLSHDASSLGARIAVFPELCITGCSCGDLFFSDTLLTSTQSAVSFIADATSGTDTIIIVGFPLLVNDKLYNCAAFCQNGKIIGVVPKTVLTSKEKRYFSVYDGDAIDVRVADRHALFGNDIIFGCADVPTLKIGIEVGSEAFAQISPSCYMASAGATLIVNPYSEWETVGADAHRKVAISSLSSRNVCAYVQAGAGDGESTTDGVFGGAHLIYENGKLLAERKPLEGGEGLTVTEIDLGIISSERRKSDSFMSDSSQSYMVAEFNLAPIDTVLTRHISPSPFIPECDVERSERCEQILTVQAKGLAQRIEKAYAKSCVIGISGGLDSCLAILVAARAMDILGRPRTDVIGVTMPCFGTTQRTKSNAELLCSELGTQLRCVNIGASVRQHFSDIGHDEGDHSVVYENAQARERTQVIMDIANMENGLVIGTGDLSELALGWATYNGDHMSMYGVNGGVPKTLIRHIVAYCADEADEGGKTGLASVLRDILDTPVSPELLPADEDGNIAQKTEDLVGPYEIHDFYIYYMLRYGFAPDKLYRMARVAFAGKYDDETLKKWLTNLVRRFFAQQFKRSCLPDGPKIGTVGVSPRGDLCMPSDASSAEWLKYTK